MPYTIISSLRQNYDKICNLLKPMYASLPHIFSALCARALAQPPAHSHGHARTRLLRPNETCEPQGQQIRVKAHFFNRPAPEQNPKLSGSYLRDQPGQQINITDHHERGPVLHPRFLCAKSNSAELSLTPKHVPHFFFWAAEKISLEGLSSPAYRNLDSSGSQPMAIYAFRKPLSGGNGAPCGVEITNECCRPLPTNT